MNNDQLLKVKELKKSFGDRIILRNISFTLKKGEVVGLIAPNGTGKSTLFKAITGLIRLDDGEIFVEDKETPASKKDICERISAIIESPGLFESMSGYDNIYLFGGLYNIPKKEIKEEALKWIDHQDLKKKVSKYSMGMKQRLALFIMLMKKSDILILDEPFNGLDPGIVFSLRKIIRNLVEQGKGVIVSAHQLSEIEAVSDRFLFLVDGEVLEFDKSQNLEELYMDLYLKTPTTF